MMKIDLNSDLGESFGMYTIGNDSDVLNYVSSANIACGMHAGDPFVMHKTVRLALERGVAVGAHPGFMDLNGFGRRNIVMKPDEIYDLIVYQVGALSAFVKAEGGRLQHVKPHGALYNLAAKDQAMSEAIAKAVYDVDPQLVLFGLAGSWLVKAGEAAGLQTASEVFDLSGRRVADAADAAERRDYRRRRVDTAGADDDYRRQGLYGDGQGYSRQSRYGLHSR